MPPCTYLIHAAEAVNPPVPAATGSELLCLIGFNQRERRAGRIPDRILLVTGGESFAQLPAAALRWNIIGKKTMCHYVTLASVQSTEGTERSGVHATA